MKKDILKQIRELHVTASQSDILTISTGANNIEFSTSADVAEMCQKYGRIYSSDFAVTSQKMEAVVGDKNITFLSAVNFICEPLNPPLSFEVELVSQVTGSKVIGSIEYQGQGQYAITYQPIIKGIHELHIKADGQHVRGSPLNVTAKLPLEILGTPIQTLCNNNIRELWGVTTWILCWLTGVQMLST